MLNSFTIKNKNKMKELSEDKYNMWVDVYNTDDIAKENIDEITNRFWNKHLNKKGKINFNVLTNEHRKLIIETHLHECIIRLKIMDINEKNKRQ